MAKVITVWGPPAAGKTTYVADNMGRNDMVFDYDKLMEQVSGRQLYDHNDNLLSYLTGFRGLILSKLAEERNIDTAWIIASYPREALRQTLDGLGAEYVLLDPGKETCANRIREDPLRDNTEWLAVLDRWYERYERHEEDNQGGGGNMAKTKFWAAKKVDETVGELTLYGDISSTTWYGDEVTPQQFKDDLANLGDVKELKVYINSPGGDVFAGQAIYSQLRRHKAKVNVYIDGLAASIASVIAMAGDTVTMPKNAMMMIHSPWVMMAGNAADLRKMADDLEKIQISIEEAYKGKVSVDDDKLKELIAAETWLTAEECLEYGFCDVVEKEKTIAASIEGGFLLLNGQRHDLSRYSNPPKMIMASPGNVPAGEDTQNLDARLLAAYAARVKQLERMIKE